MWRRIIKKFKNTNNERSEYADAILNSLGSHVAILDSNGVITAVNNSWKKFAEQNKGKIVSVSEGVNYMDVCLKAVTEGDKDAEKALNGIRSILEGRTDVFNMEYPCHSLDEKRWFFMNVNPLVYRSGKILITHSEITVRMLALRNLERMNETLRHITSSISGVVFQFVKHGDGSYSIPYISDQVYDLAGFTAAEIRNKPELFFKPIHPDDLKMIFESIEHSFQNMSKYSVEHRLITPKGEVRWFRVESTPNRLSGGDILWNGVSIDITGRIKTEAELREKTAELESQSKELTEANAALKAILHQIESDKHELEENVARNIRELVFPYIHSLNAGLKNDELKRFVKVIETNLQEIISPFLKRMTLSFFDLSPMESKVAHLIKEGLGNKEIANIFSVSESTIKTHRAKIREKLGLRNKKVNLRSYLLKYDTQ